jgi:hypothetical protein
MTAEKTTITEKCLVKIGRTGDRTHRGSVTLEIADAGQPWERRKIVAVACSCRMTGGVGRLAAKVIAFPGTDPDKSTCEWCH